MKTVVVFLVLWPGPPDRLATTVVESIEVCHAMAFAHNMHRLDTGMPHLSQAWCDEWELEEKEA